MEINESLQKELKAITTRIPDISFDIYVRLLPGLYALITLLALELVSFDIYKLNWPLTVLILLIAYGIGHIVQPLSGYIVKSIQLIGKESKTLEEAYKLAKDDKTKLSKTNKVNKAHSEANSMASLAIISSIAFVYYQWFAKIESNPWWAIVPILFCLFTYWRIRARHRKIRDLTK
ncbi:MAG: hypothetical protein HKN09_02840 [Saprospiraceae bacterium]|nr:hypothetical protein [Saprospiraceae bacterium]